MADNIFEDKRLVEIYDIFDGDRNDLIHYVSIVEELKAKCVLDIGCGTGCLAILLNKKGIQVTGLDPAKASIDFAKTKEGASGIDWIVGNSSHVKNLNIDLAVMTGNVGQVFLEDQEFLNVLKDIKGALIEKGYLVFEVRNPEKKDWENWTPEKTFERRFIEKLGFVEGYCELIDVEKNLVSFRWNYFFEREDIKISSNSTLKFRTKEQVIALIEQAGFNLIEIREAPDRIGKEFVFIVQST